MPFGLTYRVRNDGTAALQWTAESTEVWATLSSTGGLLLPGEEVTVDMVIDQKEAGTLPAGVYTGSIDFTDMTGGVVGAVLSRGLVLDIEARVGLTVSPIDGLLSDGEEGGPFTPSMLDYTLANTSNTALDWEAASSDSSVSISSTGGRLDPGAQEVLTVSINAAVAALAPPGTYTADVTITDKNTGRVITRQVTLNVRVAPGGGATARKITQFGVTWTFDGLYEVGQFANKDWWVVGPVTIVDIDPPSTDLGGGRTLNGSMLNPSPFRDQTQAYDSTMYAQYKVSSNYNPLLNAALNVSAASPLVVKANNSLVSTISKAAPNTRPQLKTAAILTVLDQAPPAGSFRPPYSGENKRIRFNESQLDYSMLARLPRLPSTPGMASVRQQFRRPWIDHVPLWIGRYLHPVDNMPDYGREIGNAVSTASLMLNSDFTDAEKRDLLVSFVQLGIDFYGIAQDGGKDNWPPSAGHMNGRKWPILFAGIVLGDPDMGSVGFDKSIQFGEDGQTFYVEETSPGVYNNGFGGYTAAHVGMPEWGTAHANKPSLDDVTWFGDPYRLCCTTNSWWGMVLAAHAMGAKALWNHDPLFDYMDRYLLENTARGIEDWRLSWTQFPLDMWKAYRDDYP
jgi:hypothetical protein